MHNEIFVSKNESMEYQARYNGKLLSGFPISDQVIADIEEIFDDDTY